MICSFLFLSLNLVPRAGVEEGIIGGQLLLPGRVFRVPPRMLFLTSLAILLLIFVLTHLVLIWQRGQRQGSSIPSRHVHLSTRVPTPKDIHKNPRLVVVPQSSPLPPVLWEAGGITA